MHHIAIISGSVRTGRNSHRVSLYLKNFIKENNLATSEILDLKEYNFPVFEERLKFMQDPSAEVLDFAEKIKKADGIILVTPEYNGGYPASVKNIIDLLYAEWQKKPIAISTVSDGNFGGTQVITSLIFSLWKIRALVVTAQFPVPNVTLSYDELGSPTEKDISDKRAGGFIKELLWYIEAAKRMSN